MQLREIADLINNAFVNQDDGLLKTNWPGLTFGRSTSRIPRQHIIYETSLCITFQGEKSISHGDKKIHYGSMQYLVAGLPVPCELEITKASENEPLLALTLEIDVSFVAEIFSNPNLSSTLVRDNKTDNLDFTVYPLNVRIADACMRFLNSLQDPVEMKVLAPVYYKEFVYLSLSSNNRRPLTQLLPQEPKLKRVATITRYLHGNFQNQISIEQISNELGSSVSAIHHDFRRVVGVSPIQYLKKIRLNKARELLLSGTHTSSQAGYAVGYKNASYFSQDFKRYYGALPKEVASSVGLDSV